MIVELQTQRTLIGQSNAVYLDWGRDDGLQVGDVLEVFRKRTNYPTQTIGELRVVALEDHTATALVSRSMQPLSVGDRFVLKEVVKESGQQGESGGPTTRRISAGQAAVHEALTQSLKAEIAKGDVSIKQVGNKIKINLGDLVDQLEYESGQPAIKPSGAPILKQISDILKTMTDQDIVVEGHTDSMPIGRMLMAKFPTNQELSEARAGLVVRYFIQEGIDPKSLSAIGYAERRPVASNRSEEGRRKNRRIEIELSPKESAEQAPTSPADANERPIPPPSSRLN
jgi:chemotaxis protein MotB